MILVQMLQIIENCATVTADSLPNMDFIDIIIAILSML